MEFNMTEAIEKYGPIFYVETPESKIKVYCRLVTKKEYDRFNSLCTEESISTEAEEYLYKAGVIYPTTEELDDLIYAGELSHIVMNIARSSGFFDIDIFTTAVKNSRQGCQKLSEQIMIFVCKAMPGYRLEDIEKLNYLDVARLLAISEIIMGQELNIGPDGPPKSFLKEAIKLSKEQEEQQRNLMTEQARSALSSIKGR